MAVPVLAAPSISSVSPSAGYQGSTNTFTITGSNFNVSTVKLENDGDDITGSIIGTPTNTSISVKFYFSTSDEVAKWDLVVRNKDGTEDTQSNAIAIRPKITLTSITPSYGRTNNDSVEVTIVGTGLSDVANFYLYNDDYSNVSAMDVDAISAVKVTGVLDLTDVEVADYEVCVVDSYGKTECDLEFEVTSDEVGSIDFSSTPSGASIYIDSVYKGTTPASIDDIDVGSHKVVLKKSGYENYEKMVRVTAADVVTLDAKLYAVATATQSTVPTTKMVVTTATLPPTTVKSSKTVPTPWATATPTPESPVGISVIIGALAIGILALSRR